MLAQMQAQQMNPQQMQQNQQYNAQMRMKGLSGSPLQQNTLLSPGSMHGFQPQPGQGQQQGGMWQPTFDGLPDGHSPSDSWSTGSAQGQPVPSTLNVEDW